MVAESGQQQYTDRKTLESVSCEHYYTRPVRSRLNVMVSYIYRYFASSHKRLDEALWKQVP